MFLRRVDRPDLFDTNDLEIFFFCIFIVCFNLYEIVENDRVLWLKRYIEYNNFVLYIRRKYYSKDYQIIIIFFPCTRIDLYIIQNIFFATNSSNLAPSVLDTIDFHTIIYCNFIFFTNSPPTSLLYFTFNLCNFIQAAFVFERNSAKSYDVLNVAVFHSRRFKSAHTCSFDINTAAIPRSVRIRSHTRSFAAKLSRDARSGQVKHISSSESRDITARIVTNVAAVSSVEARGHRFFAIRTNSQGALATRYRFCFTIHDVLSHAATVGAVADIQFKLLLIPHPTNARRFNQFSKLVRTSFD